MCGGEVERQDTVCEISMAFIENRPIFIIKNHNKVRDQANSVNKGIFIFIVEAQAPIKKQEMTRSEIQPILAKPGGGQSSLLLSGCGAMTLVKPGGREITLGA